MVFLWLPALAGVGLVGWGLVGWNRSPPQKVSLTVVCSLAGFISASLSALLEACVALGKTYAATMGKIPSPEIPGNFIRFGLATAVLGLVLGLCGAIGKGPVRSKAPALAALQFWLWFLFAISKNPL